MKHVGDITKLHGYDLPPVDVITGGSPCQDLSVAGKRAGMLHEANGDAETTRSGLFYDQIRVIKEMREAYVQEPAGSDQLVRGVRYPRYSIWENVPGALSAGKEKGEAFQAVLTEFVRIVEPDAPPVPMPDKGKWPTAGCLYDPMGRWSVAWRVHDLQFWGCPQRRKRLCVLVDFDGPTAPWILFDPEFRGEAEDTPPVETESDTRTESRSEVQPLGEGLRGYSEQSGAQGQGTAGAAESSTGVASTITATYGTKWNGNAGAYSGGNFVIEEPESYVMAAGETGQGYWQPGIQTLRAEGENRPSRPSNVVVMAFTQNQREEIRDLEDRAGILSAENGSHQQTYVMAEGLDAYNQEATGETSMTLTAKRSDPNHVPCVMPINTMVGTRDTPETRTTFGVGEPDDPQFTLSSAHEHAVFVDVYNQSVDGDIAASITAAVGGSNTSGPKIMSSGFKPRQSAAARDIGYEEEKSPTILTDENYSVLCLNDQGGEQMAVSYDQTSTLRAQMKHHEPIVYDGSNVTCPTNASNPHRGDPCHTLTAGDRNYLVYENHSQDTRYKELGDICQTVSATYGMGGNNQPLVLESNQNHATVTEDGVCNTLPAAMGMGGGYVPMVVDDPIGFTNRGYASGEVTETLRSDPHGAYPCIAIDQQGGKGGANYAEDVCPAVLSDSHGTPHAVAYGISAFDSNAMKSSNPHSGIYEADSSRTLDLNGGSPACNQGGVAIVEPVPIEGNGQRESHRGDGYGDSGDPMFTLNSTEHHAVAESYQDTTGSLMASGYDKLGTQEAMNDMYVVGEEKEGVECMQNGWYQATGDMSPSLLARDYKDPPVVKKPRSVVRRLTPKECERLQGFPDDWTNLGEWTDSKGKKHKDADSPRYKALGNSIGLPFWQWLAERICAQYPEGTQVRLGSLFDGIGGFPLVFERCGGKAVWASEIEEFPIAVTKKHFPEEE